VANRGNEDELLLFALRSTASHVAERFHELRCGSAESIDSAAHVPMRTGHCVFAVTDFDTR